MNVDIIDLMHQNIVCNRKSTGLDKTIEAMRQARLIKLYKDNRNNSLFRNCEKCGRSFMIDAMFIKESITHRARTKDGLRKRQVNYRYFCMTCHR
jgi:hypothetical protein